MANANLGHEADASIFGDRGTTMLSLSPRSRPLTFTSDGMREYRLDTNDESSCERLKKSSSSPS